MTKIQSCRPGYRVAIVEWTSWSQHIEADSAEEAEAIALRDWEKNGSANFKLRDCGDEIDVREV